MDRFLWATNPLNKSDNPNFMGYVLDTVAHQYYRVERKPGTKTFYMTFEKSYDSKELHSGRFRAKHWLISLLRSIEGGNIRVSI
jgi:hypothetical protein